MLLSAVSVLVVAQSSSEIPEGLMNNPIYKNFINFFPHQYVMIKLMKFKWVGRAENVIKFWSVELKGIYRFVRHWFRLNNSSSSSSSCSSSNNNNNNNNNQMLRPRETEM